MSLARRIGLQPPHPYEPDGFRRSQGKTLAKKAQEMHCAAGRNG
jgi:hypothetical protein